MSFFQVRTLPCNHWPPLPDGVFCQVWNAYQELERTQWLEPAELERRQLAQVRALLDHCLQHVPYYRHILPAAGIVPAVVQSMDDFRRIPRLPRKTYQEKFAALTATKLPLGTQATTDIVQTSGSSGTPTNVLQTNMTNLWWFAFYLRDLAWSNLDPTGSMAAIRSTGKQGVELEQRLRGITQPCWMPALDPLLETGYSHLMDIQQDQRVQMQWLRRIAPDYLLSYPANLEMLAQLVRQEGPIPSLRAIQSISDTLTPEAKANIESAFGVPVKNSYSCAETGYLASPCPEGHGLHVHAENVLLEVLDEAGNPCAPGQTGQVYVTHLHNLRGPFLRYELGDEATIASAPCPCGRGLPLLAKVHGKSYPLFRLPNGRQRSSITVALLIRWIGGHWQHQVIQKDVDHIVVRLVRDTNWTDKHGDEIRRQLQEFFEAPIRVELEFHERLAFSTRGKFQSMINEMK